MATNEELEKALGVFREGARAKIARIKELELQAKARKAHIDLLESMITAHIRTSEDGLGDLQQQMDLAMY